MLSDHLSCQSGRDFYKEIGLENHLRLNSNFGNMFMFDKSIIILLTRCFTFSRQPNIVKGMKNSNEVWLLIKYVLTVGQVSTFLIVSKDLRELIFQKSTRTKIYPGYATNSARSNGLLPIYSKII